MYVTYLYTYFSVSFYSNTAGLIGIAILLNVVCMNMARERKYSNPPKFLLNLFSGCVGKLLCLGNYTNQVCLKKCLKINKSYYYNYFDIIFPVHIQVDYSLNYIVIRCRRRIKG